MKYKLRLSLFLLSALMFTSCQKYLDKKPERALAIPNTLDDLQALLDNHLVMNEKSPNIIDLVTDDYYVTPADWQSGEAGDYIWQETAGPLRPWSEPYQSPIYYSNVVLDYLDKVEVDDGELAWANTIKGSALFYRAFNYFQLSQLFCKPHSLSASADLGIVLKKTSSINEVYDRATVQQTYDQIINDLKKSIGILPDTTIYKTRPSKLAAYAVLSRVYLSMRDYTNAKIYADSFLNKKNTLLDYNNITAIPLFDQNPEVIFYSLANGASLTGRTKAKIDTVLFRSYNVNDLRRGLFYLLNSDNVTYRFKGNYSGILQYSTFDGIATDEIYLIRAECNARLDNKEQALADLNTLMVKRWKNNGSWIPFTATDATEAKNIVLSERRKELVFRGLRWSDLRRLNLEGANITLQRLINGTMYSLPPNDLRWVLLIPDAEITRSGILQNPR